MCRVSSPHLILCNSSSLVSLNRPDVHPLMYLDGKEAIWFTFWRWSVLKFFNVGEAHYRVSAGELCRARTFVSFFSQVFLRAEWSRLGRRRRSV